MNFELSEDQLALREAAVGLLDGSSPMPVVRSVVDAGGGWDRELWAAMVEQGWCGTAVAESSGGLGLGWVEVAVLAEAVGASLAPAPVVSHLVAVEFLGGTEWFDGACQGGLVATATWDPATPVPFAPSAEVMVTVLGDAVVAVVPGHPPTQPAMDCTRELAWVDVGSCPVHRLDGDPARLLDYGAVAYSAELLGICQRALDLTVAYAKERVQFDRPIGSFQAVKHRCADMLVDVEGMRSAVYWAAWCLSADDPDRSAAASTAKTWCSDASRRVMASALQVHGGIGFTWEADIHLYLKRAQLDQREFGDATYHRSRLGALLRDKVEAGESVI